MTIRDEDTKLAADMFARIGWEVSPRELRSGAQAIADARERENEACEALARGQAQSLYVRMSSKPIGSDERRELSLRSGQLASVADAICTRRTP